MGQSEPDPQDSKSKSKVTRIRNNELSINAEVLDRYDKNAQN